MSAFVIRLQWRCMYCQRFEMRCEMEHTSLCTAWEKLRRGKTFMYGDAALLNGTTDEERLEAFEQGRTGYPFVDACMRCLLQTGWLNFRMRCMLVSFAVYNLWLDWKAIAGHMARVFLDYEPGIHYPQMQMQAGTTGVDLRCYSMTRQAKEQDPHGTFIKRYVPELSQLGPERSVHEPWKGGLTGSGKGHRNSSGSSSAHTADGKYPPRIVDEIKTAKASKTVIAALQQWFASAQGGNPPEHLTEPLRAGETRGRDAGVKGKHSSKSELDGGILAFLTKHPAHSEGEDAQLGAQEGTETGNEHASQQNGGEDKAATPPPSKRSREPASSSSGKLGDGPLRQALRREATKRQRGDSGHASEQQGTLWACPRCTLLNYAKRCAACESPRPGLEQRPVQPGQPTGIQEHLLVHLD
jgi:hypothetical protein